MPQSRLPVLFVILLLMTAGTATSQVGAPIDPSIVYLRVAATDNSGRFVTGLDKESFKILEDNKLQDTIPFFSRDDDWISTVIVVDARADLKEQIKAIATAAVTRSSRPLDELFVSERGDVPMNDALNQGINRVIQMRKNRRALVLFTDKSNAGEYSFSKVKERLREHDVEFYVIAVYQTEPHRLDALRDLSQSSGGNFFLPNVIADLDRIFRTIVTGLRNQYVIGYRPTNQTQDGKWRKIKVTVADFRDKDNKLVKVTTRAKPGYYAPSPVKN